MITLTERVNREGLEYIKREFDIFVIPQEKAKLKRYLERISYNEDFIMVPYQKRNCRLYAEGSLSLQGFSKKIRHVLAKDIYHDVDISNAHPTILYQLCQKNGWETPELRHYIENRDVVLRTTDKRTIISIIYGSNHVHRPYQVRLSTEMRKIAPLVCSLYPEIKGKDMFSKMSNILQSIENDILMKMVEYFGHERVGVLCFDGMLVYKNGQPLDLEGCEAHITDWRIKLVEKPI